MPYLKQTLRDRWNEHIDEACNRLAAAPTSAGELNYLITRLAQAFVIGNGMAYTTLNEAVGALECAKLELYRRMVVPYEDRKISENGDVYS